MKIIAILGQLAFAAALGWLTGCASGSGKSAAHAATAVSDRKAPSTNDQQWREAVAKPSEPFEGDGWQSMFDGETLKGWRITEFAGRGEVECKSGLLIINMGDPFCGVNYTNQFPTMNYEIALDAMR